jgi:photosynthetic reaction center cytochrome c subunit
VTLRLVLLSLLSCLILLGTSRRQIETVRAEAGITGTAFDTDLPHGLFRFQDKKQSETTADDSKKAEDVYKNIQLFKGLPATGVLRAMNFFANSLGVDCTHCHTAGSFEKDDKPAKQTARKMYEMVQLSNRFLSTNKVSCYACHRGHVVPEQPPDSWKAEFEEMRKAAEQDQRPAEQVYKNVQTLKGLPAGRWNMLMTMFSKALGVDCNHCHVDGAFESDQKPAKLIARKMLGLTGAISREIYKGPTSINCYTCHKGQVKPVSFPPAAPATPPANTKPEVNRTGVLPKIDEVLQNYKRATDISGAGTNLKTRILTGNLIAQGGLTAPMEVYVKAPDKMLMIMHTPDGGATIGCNGNNVWQSSQSGLRRAEGAEALFLSHQAQSFAGTDLRQQYKKLEVVGRAKLDDREALVIETDSADRFYFDAASGLLLRQDVEMDGPQGKTQSFIEFSDYREVDGLRIPFNRKWTRPGFSFTQKFDEVKHNMEIEDSRFEKPSK